MGFKIVNGFSKARRTKLKKQASRFSSQPKIWENLKNGSLKRFSLSLNDTYQLCRGEGFASSFDSLRLNEARNWGIHPEVFRFSCLPESSNRTLFFCVFPIWLMKDFSLLFKKLVIFAKTSSDAGTRLVQLSKRLVQNFLKFSLIERMSFCLFHNGLFC